MSLIARLLRDDRGEDLVEYALLTAFVGLAGAAAWALMQDRIAAGYAASDAGVQALWESPSPGS
jgi:Flp pilus assembly pilin Flp